MIQLKILQQGTGYRYRREDYDDEGNVIYTKSSDVRCSRVKLGQKVYFIINDTQGNSYADANYYLNERMPLFGKSENTRRKAGHVIARYENFLKLMNLQTQDLDMQDITRLTRFFKGAADIQCKNGTVNDYLGTLRDYFTANDIECKPLFKKRLVETEKVTGDDFSVTMLRYTYVSNLPVNSRDKEVVPKYITMDEYARLIKLAQEAGDINGVMLMHLMFRYGIRIGGCIGLTEEDFVYMKIGGEDVPTLIMRNRLSDKPDQKAKNRKTPQSREDYTTTEYMDEWKYDDYSHYYLTESGKFVEAFILFIKNTREWAMKNKPENYKQSEADIVDPESFKEKGLDKNHYIFLNSQGKPLSAQTWAKRLRTYFFVAEIKVDKDRRKNNLSHRFRHGFAMMHAKFMDPPVPAHVLQKMMHHKYISSTMVYYNPTPEEELEQKTKLQNKVFDENPELKDIIDKYLDDNSETGNAEDEPVSE